MIDQANQISTYTPMFETGNRVREILREILNREKHKDDWYFQEPNNIDIKHNLQFLPQEIYEEALETDQLVFILSPPHTNLVAVYVLRNGCVFIPRAEIRVYAPDSLSTEALKTNIQTLCKQYQIE